jgi:hypothetical protein
MGWIGMVIFVVVEVTAFLPLPVGVKNTVFMSSPPISDTEAHVRVHFFHGSSEQRPLPAPLGAKVGADQTSAGASGENPVVSRRQSAFAFHARQIFEHDFGLLVLFRL